MKIVKMDKKIEKEQNIRTVQFRIIFWESFWK